MPKQDAEDVKHVVAVVGECIRVNDGVKVDSSKGKCVEQDGCDETWYSDRCRSPRCVPLHEVPKSRW